MDINKFEHSDNLINKQDLDRIETTIGVHFGEQLKEYVLTYGYLAHQYIELLGINSVQMLDSDMVVQTLNLHQYHPKTVGFVAIENLGAGFWGLVDKDDNAFEYDAETGQLKALNMKLSEYIVQRFQTVE